MYSKIDEFLSDWQYETECTLKYFSLISDKDVHKKYHPQVRSMGRLAWHLTETISEMLNRTGLKVHGPGEDDLIPWTMSKMIDSYKASAASAAEQVKANWTDASLEEKVNMYGEEWTKGMVLTTLVLHQAHHRGQLSIVMRMAGIKVPGVYGPANEEWEAIGQKPQE